MPPLDWIPSALNELRADGLFRGRRSVRSLADGWCEIDGRRLRNFAGNDYLNLAHDPRVIAAAINAIRDAGVGASASALVTGRTPWHAALEERLARFECQEAAVLFPTGYAANLGTLAALVGEGDIVFCDRFNHASLVDGCRLSGAKLRVYRHDDLETLERELKKSHAARRRAIVTDSVFSMDGDLAPLPALCDLAERFDAMLIVDEAHATGVFGEHGRGVAELQHVEHRGLVRIGTLSKALGSLGGFVTGPRDLCDWLWNAARTQMFSTALPAAASAAAMAALEIVETEPWRREQVLRLGADLAERLRGAGLNVPANVSGPIIPVIVGDPNETLRLSERLFDHGLLVATIRPPTVPQGTSRLRITVTFGIAESDVIALIVEVTQAAS